MFGKKQIQALEAEVQSLQTQLAQMTREKTSLGEQLDAANRRIADLEAQLQDFDLEQARAEAQAIKAEYEGLRELYRQKNQAFDDAREEKEQSFARDQAIQRHNLENEIRDNRQANQDYVARTVRTFGQSYNYYLGQIKSLMDALSNVAAQTGETLFIGENTNLRDRFGTKMQEYLKAGEDEPAEAPSEGDVTAEVAPSEGDAAAEEAPSEEAKEVE